MKQFNFKGAFAALAISFLTMTGVVQAQSISDSLEVDLQQRLQQRFPGTKFTSIKKSNVQGLYLVQMGRQVAYTDSSGQYFLFGHMFDMASKSDLTQGYIDQLGPERVDLSGLKEEDAIHFGSGSQKLIVFSDPDCPYCKQLEKELLNLQGVEILLYPFPIAQLHPNAVSVSKRIWCATDRGNAWRDYLLSGKLDVPSQQSANCATPIERNIESAARLGINATPTLISSDGRIASGTRSASEIMKWINSK